MTRYLVTVRERFQTQIVVDAHSQHHAKRVAADLFRHSPPDPPLYPHDPLEPPWSMNRSFVAAWEIES